MDDQRIEHEAAARPSEQMTDAEILKALAYCAGCWESGVRLLANLRAGDIVRALSSQEEELREMRAKLSDAQNARNIAHMLSDNRGVMCTVLRDDLHATALALRVQEEELRSLREERDRLTGVLDEERADGDETCDKLMSAEDAFKRAETELQRLREGMRAKVEQAFREGSWCSHDSPSVEHAAAMAVVVDWLLGIGPEPVGPGQQRPDADVAFPVEEG